LPQQKGDEESWGKTRTGKGRESGPDENYGEKSKNCTTEQPEKRIPGESKISKNGYRKKGDPKS